MSIALKTKSCQTSGIVEIVGKKARQRVVCTTKDDDVDLLDMI